MTFLILAICWWSLIELVLEIGTGSSNSAQLVVLMARLTLIVAGLVAILDVHPARYVFLFLCSMSVLAIAPTLPLEFNQFTAISLVCLVECAAKAAFVFMSCAESMCEKSTGESCAYVHRRTETLFPPPVRRAS